TSTESSVLPAPEDPILSRAIFDSNPTWGNHHNVLPVEYFLYYIGILQACAHNPTGVDPTFEQWEQIRLLVRQMKLCYSVHTRGSLDIDAQAVRMFVADGDEFW
ncbi:unnamed protein product, partial [Thlaspi arvense]